MASGSLLSFHPQLRALDAAGPRGHPVLCPLGNDTSGPWNRPPGRPTRRRLRPQAPSLPPGSPTALAGSRAQDSRHPPTSGFQDLQVSGVLGRGRGAGGHSQGHVSVQQLLQLLQEGLALWEQARVRERLPHPTRRGRGLPPRRPQLPTARPDRRAACWPCCVPGPGTARSLRVRGEGHAPAGKTSR